MHLRGAGISEAEVDTTLSQGFDQRSRTIHVKSFLKIGFVLWSIGVPPSVTAIIWALPKARHHSI
jgi:hypothetical protein